jgi:hypothetical protein
MGRPRGPFLPTRTYKDELDHQRHRAFLRQRAQANYRNEGWTITIEEYFILWRPELWTQRGRGRHDLCMIRPDVEKAWSLDNCQVVVRYQQLCRGKQMKKIKGYESL